MYKVQSPILFLIFNRPDVTRKVFEEIKKVRPQKLYIGADGPRYDNLVDEVKCKECLEIISEIDWKCEVKTIINKRNYGCKLSVSNSISWFFDNEEEGIILEDDCLPSIDFFKFCDKLLFKYRNDNRIGHITGSNFQNNIIRGEADYYFSRHPIVWGWASWRRVWVDYDISMSKLDLLIQNDGASVLTDNGRIKGSIYNNFIRTKAGEINTWDYQYFYSLLINGYLSIIPNFNLISNIGFGPEATHTFIATNERSMQVFMSLPEPLVHPEIFVSNFNADKFSFKSENPNFLFRVVNKVNSVALNYLNFFKLLFIV